MSDKSGLKKHVDTKPKQLKKSCSNFRIAGGELHEKSMKILFYIATLRPDDLIDQKKVSKVLDMPVTTANYHFKKLRELGFLNNYNEITSGGQKAIQHFVHQDKSQTKKLRAHKIQISTQVKRLPNNFFNLKHKALQPFTNQRYRGLKTTIQGTKVLFYSNSKLLLKLPDVYGNTNEEILSAIMDSIEQLYQVLEQEFKGLKLGTYEICKFSSMHCAITNSIIAENYLLKTGSCYESENVSIDNSHNLPELECETLRNIHETMDILTGYEDIFKENSQWWQTILRISKETSQSLKTMYDKNIYTNANKLLADKAQLQNDKNNKMSQMHETPQIPDGYGSYFL